MARDAKKKGKKRKPTTAPKTKNVSGVVLDAKNSKWKQEVDQLAADDSLEVIGDDVTDIDWNFWKCTVSEKKNFFYCDTGGNKGNSGEITHKKVEWAFLFGPKGKSGGYTGEQYEALCTSDPSDPPAPESLFSKHPYYLPLFPKIFGRPTPGREIVMATAFHDESRRAIPGRLFAKRPQ